LGVAHPLEFVPLVLQTQFNGLKILLNQQLSTVAPNKVLNLALITLDKITILSTSLNFLAEKFFGVSVAVYGKNCSL
jgi:hypothetical protein